VINPRHRSLFDGIIDEVAWSIDGVDFAASLGFDELDPWQIEVLRSDAPRILLNCGRQTGKSTIAAIIALQNALTNPGSVSLLVSPGLRSSSELFKKVMGMWKSLGKPIESEIETQLTLTLQNGSRVVALPGSDSNIRGFTADLIIEEEAARTSDALHEAVRPMLAVTSGRLILLSTPSGKRGHFWHAWEKEDDWLKFEVPASSCHRIPKSFLDSERLRGERYFLQEFCCSFQDNEASVWSRVVLDRACNGDFEELSFDGIDDDDEDQNVDDTGFFSSHVPKDSDVLSESANEDHEQTIIDELQLDKV
jgi:hypothetical protein